MRQYQHDEALGVSMSLGECPLWDETTERLFWIDVWAGRIHSCALDGSNRRSWSLNEPIGCINLDRAGGVVAAVPTGLKRLDPQTGDIRTIDQFKALPLDMRFNDGGVDASGRLWIGSMTQDGNEAKGAFHCWAPGSEPRAVFPGYHVPNGVAFLPDGRHATVADSRVGRIDVVVLAEERIERSFTLADPTTGKPDGAAADEQGMVWFALWGKGCVIRIDLHGRIHAVLDIPEPFVSSVAFAGPDSRLLVVTTARQSSQLFGGQPKGDIYLANVGVKGAPVGRLADCRGPD
ncbi:MULTISPECIES: SMP-30/gluconolactonase/LRE family protein [unclassified Mesorhizobium]|uniref:SMP-30/gluconolactonase/LRE family protein n=1 Tax=unclassified Mesorhizobium TaxID=325217 RepID=UPI00112E19A6|nr:MULTISPECIES: SMP-30/gluconolactonase/LRE family protein [unclassified Mesorhizobium]MBZ9811285.1 SMP-30/gluconolactonase/LRE family protein [Mesorhizobium sp. ESP-6-2]TPM25858.1 SMP-30/gluconolactonase/LRE family protein [Mesorhizobium sp. B2-2-2]